MGKKYNSRYKGIKQFKSIFKFFKRISVLHKYLLDKNVSIMKKIIVLLMILYVFSPIDLIPEVVLGFGIIDDTLLVVLVLSFISKELDKYTGEVKTEMGKVIQFSKKNDEEK